MQFIQIRGSGDVYYHTPALAAREDIDVIEAPDGATPDEVKASLLEARGRLSAEAKLAAQEASHALATKTAARTRKVTAISADGGLQIDLGGGNGAGE